MVRWFHRTFKPCGHSLDQQKSRLMPLEKSVDIYIYIHPPKQTWNLKMDPWKRRFLLETIISSFHVEFQGCIYIYIYIPRESKNQTLPIGSGESFICIILKAILCLVLDFQDIIPLIRHIWRWFSFSPRWDMLVSGRVFIYIYYIYMCQGRSTPYIGDGHPTFNDGNPYNKYINPYYMVDDHPYHRKTMGV